MIKLTIKITKEVLEATRMCGRIKAMSSIVENCAIAYAVREVFPGAQVGNYYISSEFLPNMIVLPPSARDFIKMFDSKGPNARVRLPEFSFDIEVPDLVIESIGIEQAKEIISKSSTLELIES